jgi:tetratricopeptide (TPR) repeat protein
MNYSDLRDHLPSNLESAFWKQAVPGEDILVSLPGAIGEALVVTDRRIALLREKEHSDGVDMYSYPLPAVSGISIGKSDTGGTLVVDVHGTAEEVQRTLYFASYEREKFQSAVDSIGKLLSVSQAALDYGRQHSHHGGAAPAGATATAAASQAACVGCGSAMGLRDVFCTGCGESAADVCMVCSASMPRTAKFCPHCGSDAHPAALECYECKARTNSAVMTYCPHCGISLTPKCASCGAGVVPGHPRCRYCGRVAGADGVEGRGLRLHRERQQEEQAAARSPEAGAPAETEPRSPAAEHNAKGAELFDQEKVQEAIDEFRRAVVLEPENASYHCNLAVAYEEAEMEEDALREYERTLELNPSDPTALLYLGYLVNERDDPDRAAEMWRRLKAVAPGTPEAEEAEQNLRAQESL